MSKIISKNWKMVKKIKNERNRKNGENAKIAKIGQNKWGRLGRYRNRSELRKNVLNSWDRDLSIGDLKWSARGQKNVKKGHCVSCFWTLVSSPYCWQPEFWCFDVSEGSEKLNLASKNSFSFQISSKTCFLAHLHFFGISKFRFPLFQILSSFQFFAFFNFDGVKQVGGWVGSLQKLIFTRGS